MQWPKGQNEKQLYTKHCFTDN